MDEIEIDILAGRLAPGDKLPSVREWSCQKQVNPNTLLRALAELEERGLIYTERTNGKFVVDNEHYIDKMRHAYAKKIQSEYRARMREIGLQPKF